MLYQYRLYVLKYPKMGKMDEKAKQDVEMY